MSRIQHDQLIDDDEEESCPLCVETLDLSDRNFRPCPCGYQICQFCYNNIKTTLNGLCPACRRPYDDKSIEWKAISTEEAETASKQRKQAAAKQKEAQKREADSLSRKHLAGLRVVQKNLVYVTGLSPRVQEEQLLETLRGDQYFGQYGKIIKIVVSKAKQSSVHPPQSVGVYVTFARKEDAASCIQAVDGSPNGERTLRAQFGTTKYCSAYLRGDECTNKSCMFLHEPGEENESFTRQDLSSMNVIGTQQSARGSLSRPQQVQPPLQQVPKPIAAAVQPMLREGSGDGFATSSETSDGPALPSSASWANKDLQQQLSRRPSVATASSSASPMVSKTTPASAITTSTTGASKASVKVLNMADKTALIPNTQSTVRVTLHAAVEEFPVKALIRAISNPGALFRFDDNSLSPEDLEFVKRFPLLIDPDGGRKRRAMKERELERQKTEQRGVAQNQGIARTEVSRDREEHNQGLGGSLQLGGEPEDRLGSATGQKQHAIQPPQLSSQHSVGSLAEDIADLGLGRGLTPQQQQQKQQLLQQFNAAGPQTAFASSSASGHARNQSRFSFANETSSAAASVKPVANAKLMSQQSSMMPPQNSQFGAAVQPQQSSFFASGVQGPPPGLKTSGTPPMSGGAMFAQGHGFASSSLSFTASAPGRQDPAILRDIMQGQRAAGVGADVQKPEQVAHKPSVASQEGTPIDILKNSSSLPMQKLTDHEPRSTLIPTALRPTEHDPNPAKMLPDQILRSNLHIEEQRAPISAGNIEMGASEHDPGQVQLENPGAQHARTASTKHQDIMEWPALSTSIQTKASSEASTKSDKNENSRAHHSRGQAGKSKAEVKVLQSVGMDANLKTAPQVSIPEAVSAQTSRGDKVKGVSQIVDNRAVAGSITGKRVPPGKLDISAAMQKVEPQSTLTNQIDDGKETSTSSNNSPGPVKYNASDPTSASVSIENPARRTVQPRTIRVISTPKTENPPVTTAVSNTIAALVHAEPKRKTSIASINIPSTPNDIISDTASITSASASMTLSRASSPPLVGINKVGSAPVKKSKAQAVRERKEKAAKLAAEEESFAKRDEPVQAPILGRKKKEKKDKKIAVQTPTASGVTEHMESPKATADQVIEAEAAPAPAIENEPEIMVAVSGPVKDTEGSVAPEKTLTPAIILKNLQVREGLVASGLEMLKANVACLSSQLKHDQTMRFDKSDLANALVTPKKLSKDELTALLTDSEPAVWQSGPHETRLSARNLVSRSGNWLKYLSPEEEKKYLEIEARLLKAESTEGAVKWVPPPRSEKVQQLINANSSIPNVYRGYQSTYDPALYLDNENVSSSIEVGLARAAHEASAAAGSTANQNSLSTAPRRPPKAPSADEALLYVNQFMLPTVPLTHPQTGKPADAVYIGPANTNKHGANAAKFNTIDSTPGYVHGQHSYRFVGVGGEPAVVGAVGPQADSATAFRPDGPNFLHDPLRLRIGIANHSNRQQHGIEGAAGTPSSSTSTLIDAFEAVKRVTLAQQAARQGVLPHHEAAMPPVPELGFDGKRNFKSIEEGERRLAEAVREQETVEKELVQLIKRNRRAAGLPAK